MVESFDAVIEQGAVINGGGQWLATNDAQLETRDAIGESTGVTGFQSGLFGLHAILVLACVGADAKAAASSLREVSLDPSLSGYAAEALRRIEGRMPTEAQIAPVVSPPHPLDVTTLLGTWNWNVKSNHLGDPKPDFWWQRVRDKGFLTPTNGAAAAVVGGIHFESIDRGFLESAQLTNAAISSDILKAGNVVVFRTADGNLGKLQVIGYKTLHDFSFPEASLLEEGWKKFVLQRPNVEQYHLQVRWVLF